MAQYIDKDVLIAKIEKRVKYNHERAYLDRSPFMAGREEEDKDILSIVDTLEVKEVDLEKEIKEEYLKHRCYGGRDNMLVILNESQFNIIFKHFFELGLLSTITEEDCKLIWNIGDDLPYMPEEDFFKELLRRYKAQKGE